MTWRERIVAARERGEFTYDDRQASASWTTCAVGEQAQAYPHVVQVYEMFQSPKDGVLANLGGEIGAGFCNAVLTNQIDKAESLLDQIEDRVLVLKRGEA